MNSIQVLELPDFTKNRCEFTGNNREYVRIDRNVRKSLRIYLEFLGTLTDSYEGFQILLMHRHTTRFAHIRPWARIDLLWLWILPQVGKLRKQRHRTHVFNTLSLLKTSQCIILIAQCLRKSQNPLYIRTNSFRRPACVSQTNCIRHHSH